MWVVVVVVVVVVVRVLTVTVTVTVTVQMKMLVERGWLIWTWNRDGEDDGDARDPILDPQR
jgi:magnesium-transporting ATPase (P-type)